MQYNHVDNWSVYPELQPLNQLTKPPETLYLQGTWSPEIFTECVAVVGSRRMTEYGRRVIETLVPQLVLAGKTIVSGFMYGVDQYAHQTCIDAGGKTIAVLGWGINLPLEGYDQNLADRIIDHGSCLLSEWENQKPTLWTFPVRNRIVAALSSDVYVVEAAPKSGSLLTAELALKLKRQVWAVPGPITSRTSAGTNTLIATGKAKLWSGDQPQNKSPSVIHDPLLKLIDAEALTANEISRKLNLPVAAVGAQLSLFSVTGQVIEREGKYYLHAD